MISVLKSVSEVGRIHCVCAGRSCLPTFSKKMKQNQFTRRHLLVVRIRTKTTLVSDSLTPCVRNKPTDDVLKSKIMKLAKLKIKSGGR